MDVIELLQILDALDIEISILIDKLKEIYN